jgi:hypothetical protein
MLYTNRSIIMINSNQKRTHVEWQTLVDEQEKSGQSQNDFCSQRGLVLSQFVYYRSSLKNKEKSAIPQPIFKPVKLTSKDAPILSGDIKLTLPNGFQCSFPCQMDSEHIKRLVQVFLSC